ncbi:Arylsulfatase [Thalassoglobus neptunius]|uniref:Arylsulfatase n=1 Tax=Thalassoglobus neptunius TaxID=1938619 RepID=A0A5C5X669_9PLAN|nr:arylsulfatase [Thalassoglobus neptunius]TWT57831.1 Arylsulfatase [Thalassoglobus neptunius]
MYSGNRNVTLTAMGALVLLFAMSGHSVCRGADQPNVVLIYTDDQGYGDMSSLNPDSRFQTPSLDRLAREGILFTDAHCSDTVCTPSRYGLLTGRYSWRTSLKSGVFGAEREGLIADDRMTLASLFSNQGYRTIMVGKWHLGMDFPGDAPTRKNPDSRDWSQPVRDMPLDKGFDTFFGIPASMNYGVLAWLDGRYASVPPTQFTKKKPNQRAISDYRIMPPYETSPAPDLMEVAPDFIDHDCLTRFTDRAIEEIRKSAHEDQQPSPFFLYLPFTSPHKPVITLPQFQGKSEAGEYGDFMIETDWHIGRLLDVLDELQLAENTIVIVTSDNGPETTWKQRLKQYGHASNGPFREGKRSIYEGGHRVPFVMRWPNRILPGRLTGATICQTDLLATMAELLDVPLPDGAGEDSQSFLPVLLSEDSQHTRVPMIHHSSGGGFAIRDGNWKLILPHRKQKSELYNIREDPGEQHDLLAEHPEIASRLTSAITEIVENGRSTPGVPQKNDTGYWSDLTWIKQN